MRHIRTFVGHLSPEPEQRNIMVSMRVPEIHGFVNALRKCSPSTENHEQKNHVMVKLCCAIFHGFRAFLDHMHSNQGANSIYAYLGLLCLRKQAFNHFIISTIPHQVNEGNKVANV